jgi:predicted anti-sigma-YlaC factor YlaD
MTGEHDRLIDALLGPDGPELSCEDCFEELDRYVDLTLAGADSDRGVPGMHAHLQGCPACREDFDSLLELAGS